MCAHCALWIRNGLTSDEKGETKNQCLHKSIYGIGRLQMALESLCFYFNLFGCAKGMGADGVDALQHLQFTRDPLQGRRGA